MKRTTGQRKLFRFRQGSRFKQSRAAIIGRELERLARGGSIEGLKPEEVVKAARPKSSPLHAEIFKDGHSDAADKWRLHLAGNLIRDLQVEYVDLGRDERRRRPAFLYVRPKKADGSQPTTAAKRGGRYIQTERALSDAEVRMQLVETALSEHRVWQRRYQDLRELAAIFTAAERVTLRITSRTARGKLRRAA